MVVAYEEAGSVVVSRIGLDGRVTPIVRDVAAGGLDRPYAGGSFSVARNGSLAFTTDSVNRPTDVSIATGGKTRQLTRLNDLSLSGKALGTCARLKSRRRRIARTIMDPATAGFRKAQGYDHP